MWQEWMIGSWKTTPAILVSIVLMYILLLGLIRLRGLRSLTKMSPGDFIMTLTLGSIFAATVLNPKPSVFMAFMAMVGIFGIQTLISRIRLMLNNEQPILHEAPLLIMRHGEIFHDQLKQAHITEGDLRAKLREANVIQLSQVLAVVVESTGDVSVLHAKDDIELDEWLLDGVQCPD